MTKYFITSIDSLVNTFSLIESGKECEFSFETENTTLKKQKIGVDDKILVSIDDKVYYNFIVIGTNGDRVKLKKSFEIEKSIDKTINTIGDFEQISFEEYSLICERLFNDYSRGTALNEKSLIMEPQILINDKYIGRFVYKVLVFLYQLDSLARINSCFIKNIEPIYTSIKTKDISLTSVFKTSVDELKKEDLAYIDGKPRFFDDSIFKKDGEYYYLSTEWTSGKGSRLDLDSFKQLIETYYPEYSISEKFGENIFSSYVAKIPDLTQKAFNLKAFHSKSKEAGLIFSEQLILRFIASLCTKPFVILTGLSGSGKTKLAQSFVQWICESEKQYKIVPVGADWTNREPLLGYPNGLNKEEYVLPDNGSLHIITESLKEENKNKPFFLVLDEMNLSHVERYFADFLSVLESEKSIKLYDGDERKCNELEIIKEIPWPKNLFVIGTVNIDETTYMFSPKVLDRANVIEFRVSGYEMKQFLAESKKLEMNLLFSEGDEKKPGTGANMASDFLGISRQKQSSDKAVKVLNEFFPVLQKAGAEFGYRSASEINFLIGVLEKLAATDKEWDGTDIRDNDFIDIAIMQKLLPKLHGSRAKLVPVLTTLGRLCITTEYPESENGDKEFIKKCFDTEPERAIINFPISFGKIRRMFKNAILNGFTSYAEA